MPMVCASSPSGRRPRSAGAGGAAIESMNGARFVHDQLELRGWEVQIADALKVKGLAPLACKTDRASTPGCWPSSPAAGWCRRSGCPTRTCARSVSAPAGGCTSSADRARDRLGARLHDRRRDRRHRPLRLGHQAERLHRPAPARLPVTTPPMSLQLERGDTPGRQLVLELAAPTYLAHVAEVRVPHPRS